MNKILSASETHSEIEIEANQTLPSFIVLRSYKK